MHGHCWQNKSKPQEWLKYLSLLFFVFFVLSVAIIFSSKQLLYVNNILLRTTIIRLFWFLFLHQRGTNEVCGKEVGNMKAMPMLGGRIDISMIFIVGQMCN
jgi:hypothetical protein